MIVDFKGSHTQFFLVVGPLRCWYPPPLYLSGSIPLSLENGLKYILNINIKYSVKFKGTVLNLPIY